MSMHVCVCVYADLPLSSEALAALSPASLVQTSKLPREERISLHNGNHLSTCTPTPNLSYTGQKGSHSIWLKIKKISMGYPWDWFKSLLPWVSHGTDLSHQNPWDTHGNVLGHYSWLKLPMHGVLYYSWDHFKSLLAGGLVTSRDLLWWCVMTGAYSWITWLKMVPWEIGWNSLSWWFQGTILSKVI